MIKNISPPHILIACLLLISLSTQAETEADSCLFGIWETNPALQKKTVEQFTGQSINKISGLVLMRIDSNGNGKYQLKNVQIQSGSAEAGEVTVSLNGINDFTWRAISNNFTAETSDSNIKASASIKMGDMVLPLPEVPFNNNQWPTGRGQSRYICSQKQLQFDFEHKDQLIKIRWQRR